MPLPAPPPGVVILLHGASSAGKSTLARRLRDHLDRPFLHLSSDQLVDGGALPRREPDGPFAWPGPVRERFFDGFHRSIAAMAAAGNDLVVDHVIETPGWRSDLATLLTGLDVVLVGVHCDPDVLDARELARGDRRRGEGRSHVEIDRIHDQGPYDLEVDTTGGVTDELVQQLLAAWRGRGSGARALDARPDLPHPVPAVPSPPGRRRVAAVVRREGRVLMVRERVRGATGRHDGPEYWTLPGGGIEPGEDPAVAVGRELAEETALVLTAAELVAEVPHPAGPTTVFVVSTLPGEPVLGVDDLPCDCPRMVGLDWVPVPDLVPEHGGSPVPLLVCSW